MWQDHNLRNKPKPVKCVILSEEEAMPSKEGTNQNKSKSNHMLIGSPYDQIRILALRRAKFLEQVIAAE